MARPTTAAKAPGPATTFEICTAGALALAVAMGIGRFAFTPLLPLMQREGLLAADGGAWLAAANYVGYLVGALSAARLMAEPRRLVLACLFGTAALTAAMAPTQGLLPWLPMRLAAGILSAWTLVGVSSWSGAALAAAGRSDASGRIFAGVGLGIAFAGGLTWLAQPLGAPVLWWMLGAAAALAAAFVQRLWRSEASETEAKTGLAPASSARTAPAPASATATTTASVSTPTPTPTPAPATGPPRAPALPRGSTALVICYGCFGFGYILPATYLPAMARALIDDPRWFGLAWPVFGAAAALSVLLAGRAIARWGLIRVWAACQLMMAAGCLLPLLSRSGWAIGGSAMCVGGTFMVATMAGLRQARQMCPQDPAPLLARMTAAFATGQIAGPLVAWAFAHAPLGTGGAGRGDGPGLETTWALASAALTLTAAWLYRMSNNKEMVHEPTPVASSR